MALPASRFYENHLVVIVGQAADTWVPIRRLGYESHQHLFDVDVYPDGTIRYAVDCRPVDEPGPFHRAVLAHFNLNRQEEI